MKHMFNVPNDAHGKYFVELLRMYATNGITIRPRGRGSRKKHGSQHHLPLKYATHFAVYANVTDDDEHANIQQKYYSLKDAVMHFQSRTVDI